MAYTTIDKPTDFFKTYIYTPGGGGGHTNSSLSFQPDWVWFKQRNGTEDNALYDSVRGVTKRIISNSNGAETTEASGLTSFTSTGWVTGADGKSGSASQNYVSWNWKSGNSSGSSNSDGSVTTTVTANTTAGFSIVKYTNPGSGSPFTAGHGLGAKPEFIIFKQYSSTANWSVWHTGIGFSKYLVLNSTSSQATANLVTATATDTFSSYYDHHTSGQNIVAYCFAPKKGYSRFGTYTGNGNANGAFIYTGFKPAMVIIKTYTTTGGWQIYDNTRNTGNATSKFLVPSSTAAETSGSNDIDFLSNGFKTRTTSNPGTTDSFIYAAFAAEPLVASNNVVVTAR
tara:strand:- start:37 stop:1059 length:1023 start_codon:yes stop_codon:yes gene_type:complete